VGEVPSLYAALFLHCGAWLDVGGVGCVVLVAISPTYLYRRDSPANAILSLTYNVGVRARTGALQLDLLDNRRNFRVQDLQLPVEVNVLPEVPK